MKSENSNDDRQRVEEHFMLPEHLQCRAPVASLRIDRFQSLAFVIDGATKIAGLAIDLHEDLVDMPAPARECALPIDTLLVHNTSS